MLERRFKCDLSFEIKIKSLKSVKKSTDTHTMVSIVARSYFNFSKVQPSNTFKLKNSLWTVWIKKN